MSFDDFQYKAVNELVFNLNDSDILKSASKSHGSDGENSSREDPDAEPDYEKEEADIK